MARGTDLRSAGVLAAVCAIYFATAWLGLHFDPITGAATPVWPPSGLALASVLLLGPRAGAAIAVAALLANLVFGSPWLAAVGIAAGNTLEAFAGAWLLRRSKFSPALARLRDVLVLIAVSLTSTTIAATVGVLSLRAAGVASPIVLAWRVWWLGDVIGDLLVASLIFAWSTVELRQVARSRVLEMTAFVAAQGALAFVIFLGWPGLVPLSSSYAVFPLLIWATLRLGLPGATVGLLATTAIAVWGTFAGHGPFAGGERVHNLVALQTLMGVVAVTVLLLGAVLEERRQAIERREELFDVVAHDLRNPLSAILMNSAQLLRTLPPAERGTRRQKYLEFVASAAERMNHLINSLVQSVNIEAGHLVLAPVEQPVAPLVVKALELIQPLAAGKGIQLVQEGELGERALPLDGERVLQVFSNLLGNAIKFAPEDSKITVRGEWVNKAVKLSVSDEGPGIPASELPHIFDRYWKGDAKKREGAGLGLYIAKGIVEAHGGRISVACSQGRGCTFTFTLPAR